MLLKRNFVKGRQNKDVDIRLLPEGEYREAYGLEIINTEGSDLGAIEPMYSNKKLTNFDLGYGSGIYNLGSFADEFRKKIYWAVLSETGSFLFEWDDINQVQSVVLGDTRPPESRVFNLDKNHFITGIEKVITQDPKNDLLLITDDNMQPLCINIERAKSYGINNFEEEDIFLIKKPPKQAPKTTLTFTDDGSNNIEDKFFLFAYRFRYLDGEYSALSDFSNYNFTPRPFRLDYFTLDNIGMINNFNAVKIEFNTGEKQVSEIQVVVKESLSSTIKVIETFEKEKLGWDNNDTKSLIFSNNKTLIPLPQDQLTRSFDNVPRKAKSLSLIENTPVFSNYLEGYNIKDNVNYNVYLETNPIQQGEEFDTTLLLSDKLLIENPDNNEITQGRELVIYINTEIDGLSGYERTFFHTVQSDYATILDLFESDEIQNFINVINTDFQANFNQKGNYNVPPNYTLQDNPSISFANENGSVFLNLTPVTFTDSDNNNAEIIVQIAFEITTSVSIIDEVNSKSCKTNRNYEVGIIYIDKWGRRTTVLTSENNTLYVPQEYSLFENSIAVNIENKAPEWAERYKLVVKSNPLAYQTIYITEFYSEDFYTWCKLEGNNKDKVVVGDFLIIKKAGDDIITQPTKIKVIDIQRKDDDFINNNVDPEGNDIIERPGLYMKIKPIGFSMDRDDFTVRSFESPKGRFSGIPNTYLDLFTNTDVSPIEELEIPQGTSISLYVRSWREYDDGQSNVVYDNTFYAVRDYESIENWFNEIIFSRNNLYANEIYGPENRIPDQHDYLEDMYLVRGSTIVNFFGSYTPQEPGDKLYLIIGGAFSGGSAGRKANIIAKITVRIGTGVYVFETLPKQADTDIFYETEQSFLIENKNHLSGDSEIDQNQDVSSNTPAIVKTDFFNCYTQGQGVESYRVRDDFNSNHLTIDTRPSSTSVEKYREIRRFADLTYGKPYIESTNINGLNEFNLSNANFKELDKQYGSIQFTIERNNNIFILQEEKSGYVLFGKDLLTMANGKISFADIPEILGKYVPYAGDYGVGSNPESVAIDGNRVYWISARNGTPVRLSADGVSKINYGMVSEFRNLLRDNPTSKKLGAFDPYFNKYVFNISDENIKPFNVSCGQNIYKTISESFSYILNLNNLLGDTVISFSILNGEVDIEAEYDGVTYTENNITDSVSITIPREDLSLNDIQVTITPVSEFATVEITNTCPVGNPLKVISIVLADEDDIGTTMTNRYKWGDSSFFGENHLFENHEISQFLVEEGIEGVSKFPMHNSNVVMQAFKNATNTGVFNDQADNRLGYLVSNVDYAESDIQNILNEATFLPVTNTSISLATETHTSQFTFNRLNGDENLYLIWDYRNIEKAWRGINPICELISWRGINPICEDDGT